MNVLLLAGLGPTYKNSSTFVGSLLDPTTSVEAEFSAALGRDFHLGGLGFRHHGRLLPLLRPARAAGSLSLRIDGLDELGTGATPHLTAATLQSILTTNEIDHELFRLEDVWSLEREPALDFDVVFLSTTFIWHRSFLGRAIDWARERLPHARLVLGGQYSNLKYREIMNRHPEVDFIVRGDGEAAIPALIAALKQRGSLADVPNLVARNDAGDVMLNRFEYIDLEAEPSPRFVGRHAVIPYESMRGCPFSCGFCSFPHASPQWRYKSAHKIAGDWSRYRHDNGAVHIRASDSTFTVPRGRMRELLTLLPTVGIGWEAFTRANSIRDEQTVQALAAAHCRTLSIGFESMSPATLAYMNKRVNADENRRAFELLRGSAVGYRCSFMAGYPGETPEDFALTADFLRSEYVGHFMLNVFSLQDETMPVWERANEFGLTIDDPEDPDYSWRHAGMDVLQARDLVERTLTQVRWENDAAVHMLWQGEYATPLLPLASVAANMRVEKAIERLIMLPRDHADPSRRAESLYDLIGRLAEDGVELGISREQAPPLHMTAVGYAGAGGY